MVSNVLFTVAGRMDDPDFQKCRDIAEGLANEVDEVQVVVKSLVESDFEEYLKSHIPELGKDALQHKTSPLVSYNGKNYVGGVDEFVELASQQYLYKTEEPDTVYETRAANAYEKYYNDSNHLFCYMDFEKDGAPLGKVVFELDTDLCPKTCENFKQLCNTEADIKADNDKGTKLCYKNNAVHRVVPGGWIQAGDIVNESAGDGEGHSIYGKFFADECFTMSHDRAGILSMANNGAPHTNGSQFFITLGPQKYLDKKKVAFGRVIKGMKWIELIGEAKTKKQRPVATYSIADCGQIAKSC